LAAVLVLGAQAGWLGTRFVASVEADTHDLYRGRLVAAAPDQAVITTCFDGGWPRAPHRVLRNSTLDAWEAAGQPTAPNRPDERRVIARDSAGRTVALYDDLMPLRGLRGDLEPMAMYAGQSVGVIHDVESAAKLVARITVEAETALARVSASS
jgi:NAD(P)H-dependent flavin oxidoreductase YrpB (nitropropane dioxygenase family)